MSSNSSLIVMPAEYADADKEDNWAGPELGVKPGDTITLPIYEDKLRMSNEQWTPLAHKTFIVAGIAKQNTADQVEYWLLPDNLCTSRCLQGITAVWVQMV